MKVRELIEKLQELDQEVEIFLDCGEIDYIEEGLDVFDEKLYNIVLLD